VRRRILVEVLCSKGKWWHAIYKCRNYVIKNMYVQV
jgi:hypothetical protein